MSLELNQEENAGMDDMGEGGGEGGNLDGYPATIRMSASKRYQKRRSGYDKSQLDMAVDLVIKNKLSMRAASHIYKIPFSTLRTRKVFLTSGMTAAEYDRLNKSKAKKHINDLLPPPPATSSAAQVTRGSNGEDEEEDENDDDDMMMMGDEGDADGMMNNGFDETEIGGDHEEDETTTTDDVKPSQQPPITIASLAASNQNLLASFTSLINNAATNRLLMPSANFNNNNNLVSALNGSNSNLVKKPNILSIKSINNGSNVPQKRLYIKHGQLDTILSSRGLPIGGKQQQQPTLTNIGPTSSSFTNNNNNNNNNRTVTQVVNSKNRNHHASAASHNGTIRGIYNSLNSSSNNNNSNNHQFGTVGSATNGSSSGGMSTSRPATASLKLASILSGTMLSMKNKPTGSRPPIQHTIKTTAHPAANSFNNSNNRIDRRPPVTIKTSTKTSSSIRTTNSIEKINEPIANSEYLTRVGVLEEDHNGGKKPVAYKCPKCELLFVNSFFLNQHLNNNNDSKTNCRTKSSSGKKDDRVVFADSLDSCKHFTCSFCSLTTLDKCSFLAHVSMCPAAS